jgi:hypothetical protein
MLGKIVCIKDFDHIFPHKLTLKILGDHSLTPCMSSHQMNVYRVIHVFESVCNCRILKFRHFKDFLKLIWL